MTIFPMLDFTAPGLLCNYQPVLLNPFTYPPPSQILFPSLEGLVALKVWGGQGVSPRAGSVQRMLLMAGWTRYPCNREDCPPCQAPAPRCSQELAGATPANVSGTCPVNAGLNGGGLWRRSNAVGKMALALGSGSSIPWQNRGQGSDGTTIIDGSLMTSLKSQTPVHIP